MEMEIDGPAITQEGQPEQQQQTTEGLKDRLDNTRRHSSSSEGERPPLPPRPETIDLLDEDSTSRPSTARPNLQSQATTALTLKDITGQTKSDARDALIPSIGRTFLGRSLRARDSLSQLTSARGSEGGDTASIRSFIANSEEGQDESIFGDFTTETAHQGQSGKVDVLGLNEFPQDGSDADFVDEFEHIGELDEDGHNEELLLQKWKEKRKHYLILSAAGKPIYTRHGEGGLVSGYIGIIQTIISFYQEGDDALKSFVAGDTKIVILSQSTLYLVAISRLVESETQLRLQLDALYMQILSTLTLPTLNRLFSIRPSTDLKRPLQGTETLLSSLADSFTRGSPTTLLSALECLKIRKSHRQAINNILLKTRAEKLLYGLVAAGGRLVSVIRPKKHSLHPGDLQLLFNMIFEADGVKAGGGESWIPVCLPGFNSSGYLYMYVSFLNLRDDAVDVATDDDIPKDESVAIILISPDKEGFFQLQEMRDNIVEQMQKNGSMKIIMEAIKRGRPNPTDIVPGTVLRHFIYKSRAHVQFVMSSYEPEFVSIARHRRLISTYNSLHESVHARNTHVKVHHSASKSASTFAWVTQGFELYCVAGPDTNRNALSQGANKISQWVRKEEERLFIIGGAVF
ncbi:trafficking protein Mon1-domain-containing protein [Talaromyces proteolyticus]|uniref:Vacuolar fusion protein MON1 n=1 Tax=Talaromyces proteolyticus TaxID=1131652 RepID=A0AAD4L567_9EURO|nr:trafficking protein Mon1-domain-containing protein [Talaromyces proteolyticus]KAH8704780.1 trafficking protein Mon1-domain-containing protein [Talaromyces proteolyticus]